MLELIPDWQNKDLTCYFCGEKRSVKYKTKVIVIDTLPGEKDEKEVCICNKCALTFGKINTRIG